MSGFKYCYLTLIILFNINNLFAHGLKKKKKNQVLFTLIIFNGFKYFYLTLIVLFAHSLNDFRYCYLFFAHTTSFKYFYSILIMEFCINVKD